MFFILITVKRESSRSDKRFSQNLHKTLLSPALIMMFHFKGTVLLQRGNFFGSLGRDSTEFEIITYASRDHIIFICFHCRLQIGNIPVNACT